MSRLISLAAATVVSSLVSSFSISAAFAADATLADALKILQSSKKVDLTHSFSPTTPVWSGFGQATMSAAADPKTHEPYTVDKSGFRSIIYSMVGQYGTHVDPPAHFSNDGITMDKIPLDQMILPLVVLDDTKFLDKDPNHAFSIDDLKAWEKEHGEIPKGAFAALRTDMSKDWEKNPENFKRAPFPAWSLEVIKFLFEQRGVTAIGHESLDTDVTDKMESETWILQNGHYQIEVMDNLDQVPPTGSVIVVTWPKVENGYGFPARAFAILP